MVGIRRRGAVAAMAPVVPAAVAPTLSKYRINAIAKATLGLSVNPNGEIVVPSGHQRSLTHLGGGPDRTSEQGARYGRAADHSYLLIIDLPDSHYDDSVTEFSISRLYVPRAGEGAQGEVIYTLGREDNDERRAILALAPADLHSADASVNFLTFDSTYRTPVYNSVLNGLSAARCTILEWA